MVTLIVDRESHPGELIVPCTSCDRKLNLTQCSTEGLCTLYFSLNSLRGVGLEGDRQFQNFIASTQCDMTSRFGVLALMLELFAKTAWHGYSHGTGL